jgi:hypothetical protein
MEWWQDLWLNGKYPVKYLFFPCEYHPYRTLQLTKIELHVVVFVAMFFRGICKLCGMDRHEV